MFSLSQFDKDDIIQRYKRQTYLVAFPLGILLIILYAANTPLADSVFYFAMSMVVELVLLTILVWRSSRFLNTVELIFYFSVSAYFFGLIQIAINHLFAADLLNLGNLAEQLNGLSMWLIILLFGSFFTLKPAQTKFLIVYMAVGILAMFVHNLWALSMTGNLTFPFIFRWINPFTCFASAVLLILRMGALQQSHASTDALTGFLNRRALYLVLGQEVERATRYKRPFSIVLFDIDQFKVVNDTFGHLEGDKVLEELSKLINSLMRKTDHIGRWGGEEFLLALPETDGDAARYLAERFRMKIEETHFMGNYYIAASFGVTTYKTDMSLQELLECADIALYQAKNNGRNQVVVKSREVVERN